MEELFPAVPYNYIIKSQKAKGFIVLNSAKTPKWKKFTERMSINTRQEKKEEIFNGRSIP